MGLFEDLYAPNNLINQTAREGADMEKGSRLDSLNAVIDAWIARGLPDRVQLIWATGKGHFEKHAARESERVRVRPYLAPIADAYAASDLAKAWNKDLLQQTAATR